MKTYPDLFELLRNDEEARKLFESLPLYVRTSINDRPNHINSLSSLRSYVDGFTKGNT